VVVAGSGIQPACWPYLGLAQTLKPGASVFLNEHVGGMTDADLHEFLTEQAGIDLCGAPTIVRRETHTFLNSDLKRSSATGP